MIRYILILLGFFALPFILYETLVWWRARFLDPELGKPIYPWPTLTLIGLVFVIAGLIGFAHFDGAPPGSRYIPAHMDNGVFVPGQFVEP